MKSVCSLLSPVAQMQMDTRARSYAYSKQTDNKFKVVERAAKLIHI